jgi:hypothetical protein
LTIQPSRISNEAITRAYNEELDRRIKKIVSRWKGTNDKKRRSAVKLIIWILTYTFLIGATAYAGEADIVAVRVRMTGTDTFSFDVTVRHADEGWKHYADKWDVVAPDGTVLGTRTLYHPHVDEQPFTRSLSGVKISDSIKEVTVRGHDSVHQYGGKTVTVVVSNK